jgi:hypothetical protein
VQHVMNNDMTILYNRYWFLLSLVRASILHLNLLKCRWGLGDKLYGLKGSTRYQTKLKEISAEKKMHVWFPKKNKCLKTKVNLSKHLAGKTIHCPQQDPEKNDQSYIHWKGIYAEFWCQIRVPSNEKKNATTSSSVSWNLLLPWK